MQVHVKGDHHLEETASTFKLCQLKKSKTLSNA